ncbi:MAG: helix-turn-helix domain-containing protein [Pirellulales bacterium]
MLKRQIFPLETSNPTADGQPVGKDRIQDSGAIAFSASEAARRCGVGRTFLYEAIANGDLKTSKIGRRRIITLTAIQDWLKKYEE